jgi:hypothetical protein
MQTASPSLQAALERILNEAPAGQLQRPGNFREATIVMDDGKRRPAFTRDLSQDGISLMHLGKLDLTEVDLRVAATSDTSIRLRVRITWSREVKGGWYNSGGPIISVLRHPDLQRT